VLYGGQGHGWPWVGGEYIPQCVSGTATHRWPVALTRNVNKSREITEALSNPTFPHFSYPLQTRLVPTMSLRLARLALTRPRGARLVTSSSTASRTVTRPRGAAAAWFLAGVSVAGAAMWASMTTAHAESQPDPTPPSLFKNSAANRSRYGSPADYAAAVVELQAIFASDPDAITVDSDDRSHHGGSAWTYGTSFPPEAVVFPRTTEDVQAIMKVATKHRVPVVPYGNGTSLEGQFSAVSRTVIRVHSSMACLPTCVACTTALTLRWSLC
jgi:hypothetical protein